ncbi:MAG: mannosyltransferase family protein [Microbacteriaceae bacterium]
MTARETTTRSWAARLRGLPSWAHILLLYAASRIYSTALLGGVFTLATVQGWSLPSSRPDQSFFNFCVSWDGTFYRYIAQHGYPSELPMDADGFVVPNAWAFMPVFPMIARVVNLTGVHFDVAAVIVATLAGAGAAVILHRLVASVASRTAALCTTALFCFGPLGYLLQVGYAESLYLLLAFASLLALVRRRYVLLTVLAVVAAFVRPGILAVALALAVHFLVRLMSKEAFPLRDRITIVMSGLLISAAGLSWSVIATVVTGHDNAYLETELSWWVGLVGRQDFVPLTPWFAISWRWLGIGGVVLVLGIVAAYVWVLTRRSTRALGTDLVAYSASYGLYLFAVFLPQQSTLRLLMPLTPVLGNEVLWSTPAKRWTILGIGAALQPVAVVVLWFVTYP